MIIILAGQVAGLRSWHARALASRKYTTHLVAVGVLCIDRRISGLRHRKAEEWMLGPYPLREIALMGGAPVST